MKKIAILLMTLIILLAAACAAESETQDEAALLKEEYEQSVAFKTAQTLCNVGIDKVSKNGCQNVIKYNSTAWNIVTKFDSHWFPDTLRSEFVSMTSDNWVKTSETTFECDVFVTQRVTFKRRTQVTNYPFASHMCFEQTDKRKDTWLLTDFYSLPVEAEVERAKRFTEENEGLTMYTVEGKSFRGYMLVIDDPSRVFVGTIDQFSSTVGGMFLDKLVAKYDALGGINGGGFEDDKSKSGGVPLGYMVSEGKYLSRNLQRQGWVVMGFTPDDVLHVGVYSNDELEQMNMRDALSFYPALIINGEKTRITQELRYSARTAIGQDADGRVLMLVVQGRQPDSFGASFENLQDVMLAFGAVNAGNLDGGHSSAMWLADECVYSGYPIEVSRNMPGAFLIKKP
ncbi:MAG: phosphodiester glycosidase family protein [Clostridia bacterium]|nr:phosphodiester glycosidase family protein [Clostridia bacterium]